MNDAKLYAKWHGLQVRDTTVVLSQYVKSMSWKTGDRVLDVGCGPGNVTAEELMPRLPADFGLLVGADLSAEMVQYASETYTHPKLTFTQFDIVKDLGPTSQLQPSDFDKIFSFYCLNWTPDIRKAVGNIHSLLRPGGEILILFLATCPLYNAHLTLSQKPEWQPYMKDVHQFISPYHHSSEPGEEFSKLLHDTGFEVIDCQYRVNVYNYTNLTIFKENMKAVNPFLDRIPSELQEQYFTQSITETLKVCTKEAHSTIDGTIPFKHKFIVAFGRKP